ncbi:MAG: MFS transporter [Alphaproteobacteria bacterium]|nr:MFS transporter [Alphaproteobacteria bacterium]
MNQTQKPTSTLSWRAMLNYGVGDMGLNFYWQGAGYFLLYFYTDVVGLPNTTAGIVYAIGGFVDAISDPAMGVIADRTRTRWGRYRPYLLFGAIPLGISFMLLFTAPWALPAQWVIVGAIVTHIVFRLCYTAVSIPYGALGARLTFNATQRTRLAGVRMLFGAIGGVLIVLFATSFRNVMSDKFAFLWASAFAGIVGAGLIYLTFAGTIERRLSDASNQQGVSNSYAVNKIATLLLANKPFIILVASIFLLTIANMIIIKTILYRFEYILKAPAAGGIAIILMTAAPLLAIPCWVWAYMKFDKRPAFLAGCGFTLVSLVALYFSGQHNTFTAITAYVFIAIGFSAFAVGFWSILPDTIDYGHWKSGRRMESGLIGFASATQKIAIALAGLTVGLMLDMFGYQANHEQQQETLNALHNFSVLIPILLIFLSGIVFSLYSITSKNHAAIMDKIANNKT